MEQRWLANSLWYIRPKGVGLDTLRIESRLSSQSISSRQWSDWSWLAKLYRFGILFTRLEYISVELELGST